MFSGNRLIALYGFGRIMAAPFPIPRTSGASAIAEKYRMKLGSEAIRRHTGNRLMPGSCYFSKPDQGAIARIDG